MELQFAELLSLILTGIVLVQSALLYRSVSRESWDKFLDSGATAAKQTEGTLDDKIVAGAKMATPFLDKLNFFKREPETTVTTTTTVSTPSSDDDLPIAG